MELSKATSVNSRAEELFVQLFCEAFGPEKTENLQVQYPCVDIYGRHRYIDFALESPESKIAIEIEVRPTTTLARCPKINTLMTS